MPLFPFSLISFSLVKLRSASETKRPNQEALFSASKKEPRFVLATRHRVRQAADEAVDDNDASLKKREDSAKVVINVELIGGC